MKPVADEIWRRQVANQLLAILPRSKTNAGCIDTGSAPHFFYAVGLLERLGYVNTTNNVSVVLERPIQVSSKARWDDAYHILLLCLEECRLIEYSPLGRDIVVAMAESYDVLEADLDPEKDCTGWIKISASTHTSDALLHPHVLATFEALGLVASGQWAGAAIPILWRKWANQNPTERPADTHLFQERVKAHFAWMPANVAKALTDTLSFSDDLLDRKRSMLGGQDDEDEVLRLAGQARMMELEFLLSERWRFADGWLTQNQMDECLSFGFDGLAAEMAHTLVLEQFPDSDTARALRKTHDIRAPFH